MRKNKVGVIGLGQIAYNIDKDPNRTVIWSHIKAYQTIGVDICAICDTNPKLLKIIQEECNIPNAYLDYDKMLQDQELDVVSICTPIQTHYGIIKSCIKNGVKSIFCEKTLCYNINEAKEIVQLCEDN